MGVWVKEVLSEQLARQLDTLVIFTGKIEQPAEAYLTVKDNGVRACVCVC